MYSSAKSPLLPRCMLRDRFRLFFASNNTARNSSRLTLNCPLGPCTCAPLERILVTVIVHGSSIATPPTGLAHSPKNMRPPYRLQFLQLFAHPLLYAWAFSRGSVAGRIRCTSACAASSAKTDVPPAGRRFHAFAACGHAPRSLDACRGFMFFM